MPLGGVLINLVMLATAAPEDRGTALGGIAFFGIASGALALWGLLHSRPPR
jgi:hypothetical protein